MSAHSLLKLDKGRHQTALLNTGRQLMSQHDMVCHEGWKTMKRFE